VFCVEILLNPFLNADNPNSKPENTEGVLCIIKTVRYKLVGDEEHNRYRFSKTLPARLAWVWEVGWRAGSFIFYL
jgi:hypothetical protein